MYVTKLVLMVCFHVVAAFWLPSFLLVTFTLGPSVGEEGSFRPPGLDPSSSATRRQDPGCAVLSVSLSSPVGRGRLDYLSLDFAELKPR